jgi:hypothetical protein
MATISTIFDSSFVSTSATNDSFIKNLKKSCGAALDFVAVKAVAECEGVQDLKRTIFSTGEILNITAPEFVTVGLEGSDSDVIETRNIRWWNQTLSLATLGATENLMHEYAPLNNAEIGKYFFVKRALPKRGTVAVIKLDAWMGAKVMKGVRIGNYNFDITYPESECWTDDNGVQHVCQWYGIKATSPTTCGTFGIGADNAERDVLLTEPTLRSERFGKEYMNKMFNQMSNLIEGKRYRIQIQTFDRIGHHKGDNSEFTFTDWSLVMDAISTVTRLEMSHEEAVLDRQAVAYAAAKNRRTENVYSQAEKKGEIVAVTTHDEGVANTSYVDKREFASDADKSKSLEYIFADFRNGLGMGLVSINDDRLRGFFTPSFRNGANVRPAQGAKLIRSARDVRRYRVSGLALVSAE